MINHANMTKEEETKSISYLNLMLIIRNSKNLLPASTNKISSPF